MIKNVSFRLNTDRRGHISCGVKTEKGYPRGIEGWDLSPFPELEEIYGKEPKELIVYLPSDELLMCFDCEYTEWGSNANGSYKKRTCDWEECTHRVPEKMFGQSFEAGEVSACLCAQLPEGTKRPCEYSAWLNVFIAHPETREICSLSVFTLRTGSKISGDSVYNELVKVLGLTQALQGSPRLKGIPFSLSVDMVASREKQGQKFPVWRIQALMFDAARMLAAGAHVERPMLSSGNDVADQLANMSADDAEIVQDEPPPARPTNGAKPKTTATKEAPRQAPQQAPAQKPKPREAAELQRIAQAATKDAPATPIDGPLRVRALQDLRAFTVGSELRMNALIGYLFGATSTDELKDAESQFLIDWMAVRRDGDKVLADEIAIAEAKLIYTAAQKDLPHLFTKTGDDKAKSNEPDPNAAFFDGLNAYGEPVDQQASLDLGGATSQPHPATE